MVGWVEERNPT